MNPVWPRMLLYGGAVVVAGVIIGNVLAKQHRIATDAAEEVRRQREWTKSIEDYSRIRLEQERDTDRLFERLKIDRKKLNGR